MIKTKARGTEGGAEDEVGGRCIPLAKRVSAFMVKNKQKTSKQTTKSKTKQKQKTRNRKKRVLAAVISALEIGANVKVIMDPNESFMCRYSC